MFDTFEVGRQRVKPTGSEHSASSQVASNMIHGVRFYVSCIHVVCIGVFLVLLFMQ